jgi:hypothetical protein
MFNLVFYLLFSIASSGADYTDPTKPQFGGSMGVTSTDGNMVKALDGNPSL